MHTEIEAKLKVDSHQPIEQKLIELGAGFVGDCLQRDTYFDDEGGSYKRNDKALRLRIEKADGGEKVLLTYKGPRTKSSFKAREELELLLNNPQAAEQMMSALGYKKLITLEKKRRMYRFGDCVVTLDTLPLLGEFVEIEGPSDAAITETQKKLGLGDLKHIPQSYTHLIRKKLKELGRNDTQVGFGDAL